MIVWHKLMDALLESDPLLAAKRTADIKRYTVRRWQKIHGTPLDAQQVQLYLCDVRHGDLTQEQRLFVKQCQEEIDACYRSALFRLLVSGEIVRLHLASDIGEAAALLSPAVPAASLSRDRLVRPPVPLRVPFSPTAGAGYPRLLSPSFPPDLRRFGPLDLSTRKKGRTPVRCLPPRKRRTRRAGRRYRSQRRFWHSGTQYRCGSQPKLQKNQGVPKVHPWYRGGESILCPKNALRRESP